MLALVVGAKAIAGDSSVVVDAARSHEAEVVPGFAHVRASLVDVLVLGGHQGCDGQEVGGGLAGAQDHIANAAHKGLSNVFHAVQLLLRGKACEMGQQGDGICRALVTRLVLAGRPHIN